MKDLIKRIIQDFSLEEYGLIFDRDLSLGDPLEPKRGNLVNVVAGMRRSGKTFRLFQEVRKLLDSGVSPDRILYFNFEDDRLKPYDHQLGDTVLSSFYELNPQAKTQGAYLFLDEVQEVPEWGTWLRRVVDTEKVSIYATGSSSHVLSADVATEFRGRSMTAELLPFGFNEYLRYHDAKLAGKAKYTTADDLVLKKHFEAYLLRGGFPAVQEEEKGRLAAILQSYASLVVAKDVIERHNLSNPQAISLFASRALSYNGRELSLRKTENALRSQGVKVGRAALSEALSYLEDAFLLAAVRPFSRALADDPKVSSKVYAIDPGLAWANASATTEDKGQLLEDAVYLEIRRRNTYRREGLISSYKTEKSHEVDFIVGDALSHTEDEFYQVCVSLDNEETFEREVRALREAMDERDCKNATILTLDIINKTLENSGKKIEVIPVWRWCLGK